MKGNKHDFRRILAILLCVMLFVSNLALPTFADEGTATPADREENAGEMIIDRNLEYVLPGSTPVPMSEILTTLGLTGEVTAVEISDESLFSASNESGVWIVTAHQEFSSTEWIKVTVNDAVYEITVTESGAISSGLNGTGSSGYTVDREESVVGISDGALAALKPYSVIVEDGITGGTVTADKSQAVEGETVTVTVTPETEYELQTLTYTPADTEEPVTVSLPPEPDAGTGSYTATFDMPAANVTVNAVFRSTAPSEWSQLMAAFSEGGVVTLTQDVAAQEGDGRLAVPSGKTVTLDLNGHTLGPSNNNEVIYIGGGTLILTGDGTITGGNKNLYGIYADRGGTFTMNGGTITGVNKDGVSLYAYNSFTMNGGAIRNCPQYGVFVLNSSFTLNGGEITGSGYGVEVEQSNFTLNGGKISGSSVYDVYYDCNDFHLSGGTVTGTIFLTENSRIIIDSQLDPDACYNIDMLTIDRFTEGLNGKGDLSNFRSADYNFTVALDERGEAMLVESGTVVPYVERSWDGEKVVSKLTSRNNGQWQGFPDDANITSGWYYLDHDVTKNNRITSITGDVNLILGDGNKLDVKGLYVPEGNTLTIYGQSAGTGKIYSHPSGGAAIGGYSEHNNGNIVIHSGTVEANGYDHCAGIGSNDGCTGGSITIYGGTITANGGSDGAGIGGGRSRPGGDITIYGGDITAKGGGSNGAGIGGGQHGDGGTINIYGGTVTTSDSPSENGAGIGGGDSAAGGNITVYGGTITTYSRDGAGIGGGDDGDGGSITIHGGTITSTKVNQGQGARIGGGCDGAPGTITINGGSITTEGGSGAGIGGGKRNKSGGSVTINGGVIDASGNYGIGSGEEGSDVSIDLSWTDESKETMSVTSTSYYSPVNLKNAFKDKNDGTIFPAQDSVQVRLDGRTLIPYEVEDQPAVVTIKSANVEFRGKIRLQFAFIFPENVLADEGAYVTFEKAGTITKKLVLEGTAGADSVSFIIPVPAPEYADDIVVRAFDGEDSLLTLKSVNGTNYTENGFAYSVRTYAQNKSQSGSTEEMRALAKALDNYGTASQIYFQYGDCSSLSVDTAVTAVTLEDLVPYALTTSGTRPAGVTGASIVVEFDTDNTLRITFKTDGSIALDHYTFLLDGVETVPTKNGKNAYLQVKNIAAPNLDTAHSFTVTDGQGTYTVTASALSYAYTSVKNGGSARQNLGKALYLYNRAADAYFGS